MSRSHCYHQPNAPNIAEDDSESDIELDLQELDPQPTSDNARLHDKSLLKQLPVENHIPLANLRIGRTRGFGRRRREEECDAADSEEFLQDQQGARVSDGNLEDEAPLLHPDIHPDSRQKSLDHGSRPILSRFGLTKFLVAVSAPSQEGREPSQAATSRNISIGQYPPPRFPPNAVSNAKYTAWSFLPITLYTEFSFFFNMYFLLVALSQLIPPLRIGYVSTYVVPLVFVLSISLGKEALDDIARRRRDAEANKEEYTVLRLQGAANTSRHEGRNKKRKTAMHSSRRGGHALSSISSRLDAIGEEEEHLEQNGSSSRKDVEVDELSIRSRDLKVGDVLKLEKDQRVPADLVILKSYNPELGLSATGAEPLQGQQTGPAATASKQTIEIMKDKENDDASGNAAAGETFLRTDQLDGETDWKLRLASPLTQSLDPCDFAQLKIVAGKPSKKVNEFVGTVEYTPRHLEQPSQTLLESQQPHPDKKALSAPLTIDNTAWANTVLASNATVLAVVVYTGAQTRQAMSTSAPRSKIGLLDCEINNLTKILCALTLTLSIVLVALEGFENREEMKWYVAITRFLILFSTIIPISLRVNLDMGKSVYAWFIERDKDIPGTIVRTSTIPEELGRIEYLLSDKTGTLTQNGM